MGNSEILNWVLFAKGGPGSGAQPGHEFEGNQWSDRQAQDAKEMARKAGNLSSRAPTANVVTGTLDHLAVAHAELAMEHQQAGDDLNPHSVAAQLHYTAAQSHSYAGQAAREAATSQAAGDGNERGTLNNYVNAASVAAAASRNAALAQNLTL